MISEYLKHGERNAVDMSQLAWLTHSTERAVRRAVNADRMNGIIILSGKNGYYLPDADPVKGLQEIRHFYKAMNAGLATRRKTCQMLKQYIDARTDET